LLIQPFGFYGASIATTFSQLAFFIAVYYFAQKQLYIPYELRKILLMVIVGIFLYLAGALINDLPLIWRLMIKTLLIIAFPFILYLFRFYEPVELQRLMELKQKWIKPFTFGKNKSIMQ
jgi:O-antigen/teichoic acid export membrane protein